MRCYIHIALAFAVWQLIIPYQRVDSRHSVPVNARTGVVFSPRSPFRRVQVGRPAVPLSPRSSGFRKPKPQRVVPKVVYPQRASSGVVPRVFLPVRPASRRRVTAAKIVPGLSRVFPARVAVGVNRAAPRRRPISASFANPTPVAVAPTLSNQRTVQERVGAAIRRASEQVMAEDRVMADRLTAGIDKAVKDFQTLDPLLFSESPLDVSEISHCSRVINWAARYIRDENIQISSAEALRNPEARRLKLTCPFKPPSFCQEGLRYRTVEGTCNNLRTPLMGAANTPYSRLMAPVYEKDGITGRDDLPRSKSKDGNSLSSTRRISTTIHDARANQPSDSSFSMGVPLWGQFLAHDIADRAPNKGFQGSVVKCCNQEIATPEGFCLKIDLPRNDFFRQFNRTCMDFARSIEVTNRDCSTGRREQLNQASSFVDGSAIYGTSKERLETLRSFTGGLLATSKPNHLPMTAHGNSRAVLQGLAFFLSGDDRVTDFPGLTGVETAWFREHNRIARELAKINPSWSDETIFQETRRIIIAMVQHITYSDFLPAVIGQNNMASFGLFPLLDGYFTGYHETVDPSVANGVATAAMRFGHSLMRTTFSQRDKQFAFSGPEIKLNETFFRSSLYLMHEDPLMRGFMADRSQRCDRKITVDLVNHLYQTDMGNGRDLAAFNIQRGRDHGLPSYTAWREMAGLSVPRTFDTSPSGFKDHPIEAVNLLRLVYRHPDDVDLFTGGISEIPLADEAVVGPLFAKLIGQQFQALKLGDRYWYETAEMPQSFTPGQLREIRKVSFSKILCKSFQFETIQPNAFFSETANGNGRILCETLPEINLNHWIAV